MILFGNTKIHHNMFTLTPRPDRTMFQRVLKAASDVIVRFTVPFLEKQEVKVTKAPAKRSASKKGAAAAKPEVTGLEYVFIDFTQGEE